MMRFSWQTCLIELTGTFFLMLPLGLAPDPLTFVLGVILVFYSFSFSNHITLNPLLLWVMWLQKQLNFWLMLAGWLSQVAGALLASVFIIYLTNNGFLPPSRPDEIAAITAEMLGSLGLIWVLMQTKNKIPLQQPLVSGAAYGVLRGIFGNISGGFCNPALALGFAVLENFNWEFQWLYWLGGLAGSSLAVWLVQPPNPQRGNKNRN
jgi:glycerol uptake facilitator-like aquaporin